MLTDDHVETDRSEIQSTKPVSELSSVLNIVLTGPDAIDTPKIKDLLQSPVSNCQVKVLQKLCDAAAYCDIHPVDCVILNCSDEGPDEPTALQTLRQFNAHLPVIVLAAPHSPRSSRMPDNSTGPDIVLKENLSGRHLRTNINHAVRRTRLEAVHADHVLHHRQFLNVLVHDLTSPLNQIQQLGDIIAADAAGGRFDDMAEMLSVQKSVAKQAITLIRGLETYSMLDGMFEFGKVSLSKAANAAGNRLASKIKAKRAAVNVDILPVVRGYHPHLVLIFELLIDNALLYNTSENPVVSITASQADIDDTISVQVADNGIGIAPNFHDAIFTPLKRLWTQAEYPGPGLGLASCKKIMVNHGGEIICASQEGQGSTFTLSFPA